MRGAGEGLGPVLLKRPTVHVDVWSEFKLFEGSVERLEANAAILEETADGKLLALSLNAETDRLECVFVVVEPVVFWRFVVR